MIDPENPTIHLAEELEPGWTVLHLGAPGEHHRVEAVSVLDDGRRAVTVDDGTTHVWLAEDRVHAAEPEPESDPE